MFQFHADKERYFDFQYWTARDHILPFVEPHMPAGREWEVLEIGCAEAGVLKAFVEKGHRAVGIELSESRLEHARRFQQEAMESGRLRFLNKNIYDIDPERDLGSRFDLIILKDVIEHIPEQERFIPQLTDFLKPGGRVFFGFPPWWMPFGGHQQLCRNNWLQKTPWMHLLPKGLYTRLLKWGGEQPPTIRELSDIYDTRISTFRFERLVKRAGFRIWRRRLYFLNPIYEHKFGLKTRKQLKLVEQIPWLRDLTSTAAYYLVGKEPPEQDS